MEAFAPIANVSKSEVRVSQRLKDIQFAKQWQSCGVLPKAEIAFHRLLNSSSDPVEEIMLKFELGSIKQKMNKLQEAETIFQEALATAEALKGREKEHTKLVWCNAKERSCLRLRSICGSPSR